MKNTLLLTLAATVLSLQSSCSCGIHWNEYTPRNKQSKLTHDIVRSVATASGFTSKSTKHLNGPFKKQDIELFFSNQLQTVTIRSSYCPFIPFKMNPRPWELRCQEYSKQIEDGFKLAGLPLRQLSMAEAQALHQGEKKP